jgi:hypothetical protein
MKYFAKSQNQKMVQIGDSVKNAKWYYLTDQTQPVVETLTIGEEVTILPEARGSAYYLIFLAKGTVTPPVVQTPSETVHRPTPVPISNQKSSFVKSEMSKDDWAQKEVRDFKGRCIVYSSSILKDAGMTLKSGEEEKYYAMLFSIADKLREYIYS